MRQRTRRQVLQFAASAAASAVTLPLSGLASEPARTVTRLTAPALKPLPLGEIKAGGWLQRQLRVQAGWARRASG